MMGSQASLDSLRETVPVVASTFFESLTQYKCILDEIQKHKKAMKAKGPIEDLPLFVPETERKSFHKLKSLLEQKNCSMSEKELLLFSRCHEILMGEEYPQWSSGQGSDWQVDDIPQNLKGINPILYEVFWLN